MKNNHNCNFCESTKLDEYITIKDLPIFEGIDDSDAEKYLDFSIVLCQNCGLLQQMKSELLDAELTKIYLSENSVLSTPLGFGDWGRKRLNLFLKDAEIYDLPKSILEIGSGTGVLLYELFKKGCGNLSSFESSKSILDVSNLENDFNPHIYNEFFSTEAVNKNNLISKYDLIIATSVLEHIKDVNDFLNAIHLALVESGVAILTVPNELFRFNEIDPGLMVHEHLNYFTQKTLETIIMSSGFQIIHTTVRNDSILVKFKKVEQTLNEIDFFDIICENTTLIKKYKDNLLKIIERFNYILHTHKEGKLGLYGACATSFNLLHLSHFTDFKNLIFIDSDPVKWNKKLCNISIISPNELSKHEVTSIVVIPRAFQDEIIEYLRLLKLSENIEIIKLYDI